MQIRNYFSNNPNKDFFVFAGVLISVVILAAGSLLWWQNYNDPVRQQQALLEDYQQQVEEAYRNDTYGGSTPEETLRLFVEALKKEDIELASKYFALDDNLSRDRWVDMLQKIKEKKLLSAMVSDLVKAVVDPNGSLYKNDASFVVYNESGSVAAEIDMEFNPVSKVWKIESL